MIESLRSWWNTRTLREKRLLLFGAGLVAVVLAWLLIVRPLDSALDSAKARHDRAVITLGEIEARIAAIEAARPTASGPTGAGVRDIVDGEAARVGFQLTDTTPVGNDGVRVRIAAANPTVFFGWVSQLETSYGLDVESLTARPNMDETLAVDVTFRGGG